MSSTIGKNIRLTVFGQSHSDAIGGVIDGLPAGIKLDGDIIDRFSSRRSPGADPFVSVRVEPDDTEILSGVKNGYTCDAPLGFMIRNYDIRPKDYSQFTDVPRPSHSDRPAYIHSSGYCDLSGGGHFSGRLTAPIVFAAAVIYPWLIERGVRVGAHLSALGRVVDKRFDPLGGDVNEFERLDDTRLPFLDKRCEARAKAELETAVDSSDSVGGSVECSVVGMPAGLGSPMFDGVENRISRTVFGIPGVKGIEFGSGFESVSMYGSEHNDPYLGERDGRLITASNNAGGVLGGLTTGMPVIFNVAFKPTASIARAQDTFDFRSGSMTKLEINGRHDPCIAVRAVPVVQAAAIFCAADILLDK